MGIMKCTMHPPDVRICRPLKIKLILDITLGAKELSLRLNVDGLLIESMAAITAAVLATPVSRWCIAHNHLHNEQNVLRKGLIEVLEGKRPIPMAVTNWPNE